MVIFLSVGMIERVRDELLKGYPEDTPVVVIEKVSWPEEKRVTGMLKDIADRVKEAGIKKTALIYVGEALRASHTQLKKESRLYHKDFKHGYRQ
jgi:precorrin-4/cobalt-precorrin-4 C11-methyltransferase